MKKLIALSLTMMLSFSLAACGNADSSDKKTDTPSNDTADTVSDGNGTTASDNDADDNTAASDNTDTGSASDSDMAYVKDKGTLIVGITNFEPMDYQDADGNWIGFDAELAAAFAKSLGVSVEFVEIEWDNKIMELDGKTIDCVWNGMTLTDEVLSSMECSNAYCNNAQIVIVPADQAENYQDVESLSGLHFAVENGSAGKTQVETLGLEFTEVSTQSNALMEVAAKSCDAAVIDSLMAAAMVGEGTSYSDLTYTVPLNNEEYGVGFRKGSDLAEALNAFFVSSYADGSMMKIAETYGVQAAVIEQK